MTDIEKLQNALEKLVDRVNENVATTAKLEGVITTQTTLLEANNSRTREEIAALFNARREHAEKIEAIKVDYVPKKDFELLKKDTGDEIEGVSNVVHARIEKLDERISSLAWKVASASGAVSLLITIIGMLVKGLGVFAK